MSVAILSSLIDGTGNKTTAKRIQSYLKDEQYTTHLCDTNKFGQSSQLFSTFISQNNVQAIIGVHLVKAGQLIFDLSIPYVIIAGGTDMNICTQDKDALCLMTEVVKHACYFVVFTDCVREMAVNIWPSLSGKICVQPQGVCAFPSHFSFRDLFTQFQQAKLNFDDMKVFLVIGGIRPVKDPLYIAEAVSEMHSNEPAICLVIIGPELDKEYAKQCNEIAKKLRGVFMFSELPPADVHSLMKQSCALVNCSHSEGMCGAILEAMYLGTPVIARKNEGNLSIISDNENGLIYESSEEFCSKVRLLLSDQCLREKLIANGKLYVQENHSADKERETYVTLMRKLTSVQ